MNLRQVVKFLAKALLQFVYPRQDSCLICENEPEEDGICAQCVAEIEFVEQDYCAKCGIITEQDRCVDCGEYYFTLARAVGAYSKGLKEYIKLFKYTGQRELARPLARLLEVSYYRFYKQEELDYITFIPAHKQKLYQRGFNQAQLLAKDLAKRLKVPTAKLLSRAKETKEQNKLNKAERLANISGCFRVEENINLNNKTVLLIDDIYTTGATVNEASKTLKESGVAKVLILTLATAKDNVDFYRSKAGDLA